MAVQFTITDQEYRRIARSPQQQRDLDTLLAGGTIRRADYALKGRAKQYAGDYARAFDAFLARVQAAGLHVETTLGPRGGKHSATYRLAADPITEIVASAPTGAEAVAKVASRTLCGLDIPAEDQIAWSVPDFYHGGESLPICTDCQNLYFRGVRR